MNARSRPSPKHAAAPWLVVGAGGLIGGALRQRARSEDRAVIAATRRAAAASDGCIHLDLDDDPGAWALPPLVVTTFLCAAMTGIDACERDPDAARRINVERTCVLAERLVRYGVHVVFLSTNQVFDGTRPHMPADAPYAPRTVYGRLKAEAEQRLLALDGPVTVLRLSKAAQALRALLAGWTTALRRDRAIEPFADMRAAPLPLDFIVETLTRIADRRVTGIVQASATEDVTYGDIAEHLAATLGVSQSLVRPKSAGRSDAAPRHVPRHTTLDTSRLARELGLAAPVPWAGIDQVVPDVLASAVPEDAHA